MRRSLFFTLAWLLLGSAVAMAQPDTLGQDNNALKVDKKIPVTGSEKVDFIFNRSLLVGGIRGVPFEVTRSGTYSLGIGYGIPIGKSLEFKFEPRLLWHKLYFIDSDDKWFPSSDTSETLIYEKQRVSYIEVPVALKLKLARNLVDKYKLLIEMGFVFGRRLGSTYKTRHWTDVGPDGNLVGPKVTMKTNRIEDLNKYRYGPFARIGTSWISFYGFYRLSDIFLPYRRFNHEPNTNRVYPNFGKVEVGLTIAI
jgi:hypothetical protein